MSFSAFTTAMLLATAPVNPAGSAPAWSAPLSTPAATDPAPQRLAALDQPADPSAPVAPAEPPATPAAPAPGPAPAPAQVPTPTETPSATEPAAAPPGPGTGDDVIVVTGDDTPDPGDPLQQVNAASFEFTQDVDRAIVAPIAMTYKETLPKSVRKGVHNLLSNLDEPVVFLNFLLQLKFGKAIETLARFTINTTVGLAGLVDVAKRPPFNLPRRPNGFANTLGFYGVKPGPYFYLPLIGPTTLRDFIGNRLDQLLLPMALGRPFNNPRFTIPILALSEIDARVEFDDQLKKLRAESSPYKASREYYLQRRQAEIDELRGKRSGASDPAPVPPAPVTPEPSTAPTP